VAIHPNIPEPDIQDERVPDPREPNFQDESVPDIPEPVITRIMKFWNNCAHKIPSLFGDKIRLFICALLVPEYILAWAIRQHLMARRIAKERGTLSRLVVHAVT
jgi:hypothetical protein